MSVLNDVFELSVVIAAVDKFTAPMRKMQDEMKYSQKNMDLITKSMKGFGASSKEIDKVADSLNKIQQNKAWANIAKDLADAGMQQPEIDKTAASFDNVYQKQMKAAESFQKFQGVATAGAVITGIGIGIADAFAKAAEKAGELQQAVVGVGSSMKLSPTQMQQFGNEAMTLGIPTKFSAVQTSGLLQAMYTAGLPKSQIFDKNIASQYVNFADIQEYMKHENGSDVVSSAATMAHSYQLYSAQQIAPFLNDLNAILVNSHQTMSQFQTQYQYIASQAKRSGMSSTDALDATAWVTRMGIGGTRGGGTGFADFLQRAYYGSSGAKADAAMQAAGFVQNGHSVFYDAQGKFVGLPQASAIMQQFYAKYGGNMNKINPILQAIFGTPGGKVAAGLANQGAVDQWNNIKKNQSSTADITTMQKSMNMTLGGQWTQFKTTLDDLVQVFGQQLIPILTQVLAKVNGVLSKVLEFALAHPALVKMAAEFGVILGALTLIVGPIMTVIGAIGMLSSGLEVLGGLGALLAPEVVLPILAIAGAAYLIYKNWDKIGPYFKSAWSEVSKTCKDAYDVVYKYVVAVWPQVVAVWKQWSPVLGAIAKGVWDDIIATLKIAWDFIKFFFRIEWDFISGMFKVWLDIMQGKWGQAWTDFKSTLSNMWGDIKQLFSDLWESCKQIFATWVDDAFNLGQSIMDALKSGISDMKGAVAEEWNSIVDSLPGNFGQKLEWHPAGTQAALNPNGSNITYAQAPTIHIHPSPSQNPYDIANAVANTLNRNTTTQARNSGYQVNLASMGG